MRTRLREPSLRAVLTGAVAGLALVTLTVAAALAFISTRMHQASVRLHESTSATHELARAAGALLLHSRAIDELVREDLRADVLEVLDRYAAPSNPETTNVREAVSAYFERIPPGPRSGDALTLAHGQVRELGERWVQLGSASAAELRRWDRLGDTMGVSAAAVLLSAVVLLLWWLYRRALRPLASLAAAMERFGSGDAGARADASGPTELAVMGRRFNALADALAQRRDQQLSFLAGVAHDLRTPLSTLQLALSTAERRDGGTASTATLELAARQVSRIEGMLADLLEVVRSDHGMMRVNRELVEARRLCEGVLGLFEAGAPKHRLRLVGGDRPVWVRADPLRLEQVLINLLSNATKYSPEGGTVALELERSPRQVRFHVTDQGIGVDPRELTSLFQPYRRSRRAEGIPGSGLGLFVVKKIVEAHGGDIEVRAAEGRGTRFTVAIPAPEQEGPSAES